jgi:hypothetical protein
MNELQSKKGIRRTSGGNGNQNLPQIIDEE